MTDQEKQGQDQLWGDGSGAGMHPTLALISDSLRQDLPLAEADLIASAAYARALSRCGVLSPQDGEVLARELESMLEYMREGDWVPKDAEDVHTAIEAEVTRRLPELGGRLHTGRSRNDQVGTAFRMTVRSKLDDIVDAMLELMEVIVEKAVEELDTLMPAYTHLQRAQPIRLAHWLMGYFWPIERDVERLLQARSRISVLPLGSGAVSGHPFALDREWLRRELKFDAISENSLDAVGDRDFAIEFVFACSLTCLHLSRLAEELVVWSSTEFGYVKWRNDLATGSSLMPNKKNPDLAELIRGRASQPVGDLIALLMLIKGLPSSYQRDLQEDKQPVWRSAFWTRSNLNAMAEAFRGIRFNGVKMEAALTDDTLATELADILVDRGHPFRDAYRVVSKIAAKAREIDGSLREAADAMSADELAPLNHQDFEGLTAEGAIERRKVTGGTARATIEAQIEDAREVLRFYREERE